MALLLTVAKKPAYAPQAHKINYTKFEPNRLNRFSAILHTSLKNTVMRKTSSKFENWMNNYFDQPTAGAFRSCSSKTKLFSNKPFQKSLFNMF